MTIEWYPWIVVTHVVAAFAFILAHGVSAFVAFRLRRERRPDHVATLIGLSSMSLSVMYPALLVLLVAGVIGGFAGAWWGRVWIWLSIGLLLAIATAMYLVGTRYYIAVRHAVGIAAPQDGARAGTFAEATPAELDALLTSRRPELLAVIGGVGLTAIIWLMEVKPW
jgi:hypothetical protein